MAGRRCGRLRVRTLHSAAGQRIPRGVFSCGTDAGLLSPLPAVPARCIHCGRDQHEILAGAERGRVHREAHAARPGGIRKRHDPGRHVRPSPGQRAVRYADLPGPGSQLDRRIDLLLRGLAGLEDIPALRHVPDARRRDRHRLLQVHEHHRENAPGGRRPARTRRRPRPHHQRGVPAFKPRSTANSPGYPSRASCSTSTT